MAITIYSAQVVGLEAKVISVEVDITPGLHIFSIVGLADKEIQESRERIGAAIKNLGGLAPHKKSQRVIVNLAPADIKKEGPAFDLPIALGFLLASGQVAFSPKGKLFLGELGLDGALRRVTGVLPVAILAKTIGVEELIVPKGNGGEAAVVGGMRVYEAGDLREVVEHLSGTKPITQKEPQEYHEQEPRYALDFKDIKGQEHAKRALEIAASGGHNLLMVGPPGVGKTILAQALPSILPALSFEEALEVTKIYSIAGLLDEERNFVRERPFRNPHHTASHTAVIGGGTVPRPGEITLAHHGVLFLDELPEFDRRVVESLRQPLEERNVTIARSASVARFPANFILIGAMNPCPCGNFGNPVKDCVCAPGAVTKYRKKISGPLLDRIDLHIQASPVTYEKLESAEGISSATLRERVAHARAIQQRRFKELPIHTNAEMGLQELKTFVPLGQKLKPILERAHERYRLSARAYHRLLKLSRTIADLYGMEQIEPSHLSEALSYRQMQEN